MLFAGLLVLVSITTSAEAKARASIISPADGTVIKAYSVTLVAEATPNTKRVDFYRVTKLVATDGYGADGWEVKWDLSDEMDGCHLLFAVATDEKGDKDFYSKGTLIKTYKPIPTGCARMELISPSCFEEYVWGEVKIRAVPMEGTPQRVRFWISGPGHPAIERFTIEATKVGDVWEATYVFDKPGYYAIAPEAFTARCQLPYTYFVPVWAHPPEEQIAQINITENDTLSGIVTLTITPTQGQPTTAEILIDGKSVGYATPIDYNHIYNRVIRWQYTLDTTTLPDGMHKLAVVACHKGKYCTSNPKPISVWVLNNPAKAVITLPKDGSTVHGVVEITATVVKGQASKVCFYIDDKNVACDTNGTPWSIQWDTTKYKDGVHKLYAVACHNKQCDTTADQNSITVTVNNSGQPPTTTNTAPLLTKISVSPQDVNAAQPVIVVAVGVSDDENDALSLYCHSQPGADVEHHSYCAVENIQPPYKLSCTFNAPNLKGSYTVHCKVFDGNAYSEERKESFTVVSGSKVHTLITPNGTEWVAHDVNFMLKCMMDNKPCGEEYKTYYAIAEKDDHCSAILQMQEGGYGSIECPLNSTCEKKVCYYSASTLFAEPVKESMLFKIDKEAPDISYDSPPEVTNMPVSIEFLCKDKGTGCAELSYKVNNGMWIHATKLELFESGNYSVEVRASDGLNNVATKRFSFTIDRSKPDPPEGLIVVPLDQNVLVKWNAAYDPEPSSGIKEYIIERSVEHGEFSELTRTQHLTYTDRNVAYGHTYAYRVRTVDKAGNVSEPSMDVTIVLKGTAKEESTVEEQDSSIMQEGISGEGILQEYANGGNLTAVFQGLPIVDQGLGIGIVGKEPYLEGAAVEFYTKNAGHYKYFRWDFGDGQQIAGYMANKVKHPFYLDDNVYEQTFTVTLTASTGTYVEKTRAHIRVIKSPLKVRLVKPLPANKQDKNEQIEGIVVLQDINDQNIPFERIVSIKAELGKSLLQLNRLSFKGNFSFTAEPSFQYTSPVDYLHVTAKAELNGKLHRVETWLPIYFKPAYFSVSDPLKDKTYCINEPLGTLEFTATRGGDRINDATIYVIVTDSMASNEYVAAYRNNKYVAYINKFITQSNVFDLNVILVGRDPYGNLAYRELSRIMQPTYFRIVVPVESKLYGYNQPLTFKIKPSSEPRIVSQEVFIVSGQDKQKFYFDAKERMHVLTVYLPPYSKNRLAASFTLLARTMLKNGSICETVHVLAIPLSNRMFVEFARLPDAREKDGKANVFELIVKYADNETSADIPELPAVVLVENKEELIRLKRTDKNTYVGRIKETLPEGTYLLTVKLMPPYKGEATASFTVPAGINYLALILGVLVLACALITYKHLEHRYLKHKALQAEYQREVNMLVALLNKLKEEYLARHITREQYRQRAAEIMKRLEELKQAKDKSKVSEPVSRVIHTVQIWKEWLVFNLLYMRILARRIFKKLVKVLLISLYMALLKFEASQIQSSQNNTNQKVKRMLVKI
jgi:hypothetical protein